MSSPVLDFAAEKFPIRLQCFGPDGELTWKTTIDPPARGLRRPVAIPGLGPGAVTKVRIHCADGDVFDYHDPSAGGTR